MHYDQEDIPTATLRKLPPGRPLGTKRGIAAMDHSQHHCVAWFWIDDHGARKAWFDLQSGEYIGDIV